MTTEALVSGIFFSWFLAALFWTVNALRRPVIPGEGLAPMWLAGMVVSELAPLFFVFRAAIAALLVSLGALETNIGIAGGVLFVLSEVGLVPLMVRSVASARATGASPSPLTLPRLFMRKPERIEKLADVSYGDGFTLDVYRGSDNQRAPCLIYAHPGSWMRGRPGRQARPLVYELVDRGWVVLDIRYPLSPKATFPDHVVGLKRAVAWARSNAMELGVDPRKISLSGGSSGAHLAALAALTPGRPEFQPGFETRDTSVFACVPIYGIFDLTVRNPTRYDWPFVARHVMKATLAEAPELYRLGSPLDQVNPDAPPFLVIHGELDSVVLPEESRQFVRALEQQRVPVTYHEALGAQHGFDAFASLRSRAVGRMAARWLDELAVAFDAAHSEPEAVDFTEDR